MIRGDEPARERPVPQGKPLAPAPARNYTTGNGAGGGATLARPQQPGIGSYSKNPPKVAPQIGARAGAMGMSPDEWHAIPYAQRQKMLIDKFGTNKASTPGFSDLPNAGMSAGPGVRPMPGGGLQTGNQASVPSKLPGIGLTGPLPFATIPGQLRAIPKGANQTKMSAGPGVARRKAPGTARFAKRATAMGRKMLAGGGGRARARMEAY